MVADVVKALTKLEQTVTKSFMCWLVGSDRDNSTVSVYLIYALVSLWPHLRCDVGVGGRGRVAELSLCIVHCNVYFCIITLHNSMSSSNRLIDTGV